jgi:hypothetical protein
MFLSCAWHNFAILILMRTLLSFHFRTYSISIITSQLFAYIITIVCSWFIRLVDYIITSSNSFTHDSLLVSSLSWCPTIDQASCIVHLPPHPMCTVHHMWHTELLKFYSWYGLKVGYFQNPLLSPYLETYSAIGVNLHYFIRSIIWIFTKLS